MRKILGAVIADVTKLATDKVGKTTEAVQEIISGKGMARSVEAELTALDRDNLRYFLREFLQAVVDAGNPFVVAIDNLDAADVGLISLVRFLIKTKPSRVALVLAHNSEVGDNTDWDNILADLRARGGRVFSVEPLERPAIATWFTREIDRWPTDTELDELETASHGRAMALRLAIDAIRDGTSQPIQPDYAGYYERARRGLSPDARAVAELLAVINRNAMVPRDLLAGAADNLGILNIGPALDELHDRRLLKVNAQGVALAHSLAQQSWRATINTLRLRRLAEAWFAVVAAYSVAELIRPEATGLLPIIAEPLIENRLPAEIAQIGDQLIAAGQVRSGLELLDRTWKASAERHIGANAFQHALIAARTRLELGQYAEVDEPLTQAAAAAGDVPSAKIQVLLLRMKLALRRNVYSALWDFARQLELEVGQNIDPRIEGELILNVAYRDLLDFEGIRASSDRLIRLKDESTARQQNSIDRALARSLAKLGETDFALERARAALDATTAAGSIRGVGNANLALAEVLRYRRDYERAIEAYHRAAAFGRATANRDSHLWSLLGEAAAHIESGTRDRASRSLDEVAALLAEPGYEHPLETAHFGLLSILAGRTDTAAEEAINRYESLGITWAAPYLHAFQQSGRLAGTIPI